MTEAHPHTANLVGLTAEIVAADVSNNSVPMCQLPGLIAETHAAMVRVSAPSNIGEPEEKPIPAVSVRKSITPDFLVCLEDGKKFKSLKRHLATHHDLTPEQYREKWKLPAEYPWWLQTIPRHARCWRRVQSSVEDRRQSNRQLLPGDRR